MNLHFENYSRIVRAGQAFSPGVERDKFVYAMAAVMSAHVDPDQLTKLLDQVMGDLTTSVASPRGSCG